MISLPSRLSLAIAAVALVLTALVASPTNASPVRNLPTPSHHRALNSAAAADISKVVKYTRLRNRVYSPELGRFLSRDPIGFDGGWNLYGYADNNPAQLRDPSGLRPPIEYAEQAEADAAAFMEDGNFIAAGILNLIVEPVASFGFYPVQMYSDIERVLSGEPIFIGNTDEEASDHIGRTAMGTASNAATVAALVAAAAAMHGASAGATSPCPPTSAAGQINPRLLARLAAWKAYRSGGGNRTMAQWVKLTQRQPWGTGFNSGYAKWATRLESVHGNSLLSNREAFLYRKVAADGSFRKWGVTDSLRKRYSSGELDGGQLIVHDRGLRSRILKLERDLVETNPGPDNHEPWAGRRR